MGNIKLIIAISFINCSFFGQQNPDVIIKNEIEKKLFARFAELKGWKKAPELEWNELISEDETDKVGRVATLLEKLIITRAEARELLGFPPNDSIADNDTLPDEPIPNQLPNPAGNVPTPPENRGAPKVEDPSRNVDKEKAVVPGSARPSDKGREKLSKLAEPLKYMLFEHFEGLRNDFYNQLSSYEKILCRIRKNLQ